MERLRQNDASAAIQQQAALLSDLAAKQGLFAVTDGVYHRASRPSVVALQIRITSPPNGCEPRWTR